MVPATPRKGEDEVVTLGGRDMGVLGLIGKKISALTGSDISINCTVNGWPRPDVSWYYNGQLLSVKEDSRFSVEEKEGASVLTVDDAEVSDSGNYTCNATNAAGSVDKTSEIDVVGK